MKTAVAPRSSPADVAAEPSSRSLSWQAGLWVAYPIVGLLLLDVVDLVWVGVIMPLLALVLVAVQWRRPPSGVTWSRSAADKADLIVIGVYYVGVVALFRLAFGVFGTERTAGLFLSFAAGLLLGVLGPVIYTVWYRQRSLRTLGIGLHDLRATVTLGLVLGGLQFAMTLWGYTLPEPVDWVPLLVMSLVVGAFEAVFFRGFIQNRLEATFGTASGVGGAALLYSLYHVGYGMGGREMVFLFGLGLIYAVAFRLVDSVLVLWPLLTPLGAFFNNLESGDIELPWASIAGFADVAIAMVVVLLLAQRHIRRSEKRAEHEVLGGAVTSGT